MDDHQLEDLKQFIGSRISQSEVQTSNKIEELGVRLRTLRNEMLDGFAGVGEAIEEIKKHFDERLSKLEQQTS